MREITGSLPPNPNLKTALDQWYTNYGCNAQNSGQALRVIKKHFHKIISLSFSF
jgi:hypothetical protein